MGVVVQLFLVFMQYADGELFICLPELPFCLLKVQPIISGRTLFRTREVLRSVKCENRYRAVLHGRLSERIAVRCDFTLVRKVSALSRPRQR